MDNLSQSDMSWNWFISCIPITVSPITQIILTSLLFGAVGGSVFPLLEGASKKTPELRIRASDLAKSCWIGAVGALAFVFIEISFGSIDNNFKDIQQIRLVTVSVISGYGARRLLPLLADSLAQRVKDQEEKIKQTEYKLDMYKSLSDIETRLNLIEAGELTGTLLPEIERDIRAIMPFGLVRSFHLINLARLYKRNGLISEAIRVLNSLLENMNEEDGKITNKYRIHYNLACYYSLMSENGTRNESLELALKHLYMATPPSADQQFILDRMKDDEDLDALRKTGRLENFAPPQK